MRSNVIAFEPAAASAEQAEPLEAAVREVSGRIAGNNAERRLLFNRIDELRGLSPGLRRRRVRQAPPAMSRPVTFYSIEDAEASESAPLTAA